MEVIKFDITEDRHNKRIYIDYRGESPRALIAAAPETAVERDRLRELNAEMLEALKVIVDCALHSPQALLTVINDKARAAITKAEGKEGQ